MQTKPLCPCEHKQRSATQRPKERSQTPDMCRHLVPIGGNRTASDACMMCVCVCVCARVSQWQLKDKKELICMHSHHNTVVAGTETNVSVSP